MDTIESDFYPDAYGIDGELAEKIELGSFITGASSYKEAIVGGVTRRVDDIDVFRFELPAGGAIRVEFTAYPAAGYTDDFDITAILYNQTDKVPVMDLSTSVRSSGVGLLFDPDDPYDKDITYSLVIKPTFGATPVGTYDFAVWDPLTQAKPTPGVICEIGTEFNDRFRGTEEADCFDGLDGVDRITYFASNLGVDVFLNLGKGEKGFAQDDTFKSIENVTGSRHDDRLLGNSVGNFIEGMGGKDFISGGGGHDRLKGGAGKDLIGGGSGNDRLLGGRGDDDLRGGSDNDILLGGVGNDDLYGIEGSNTLRGEDGEDRMFISSDGFDFLNGGADSDVALLRHVSGAAKIKQNQSGDWVVKLKGEKLAKIVETEKIVGNSSGNIFTGADGNINIAGKGGKDTILAGRGENGIFAGGRDDKIILGAAKKDVVRGQGGQDTFVFATRAVLEAKHKVQADSGVREVIIRDFDIAESDGKWQGDYLAFDGFVAFSNAEQIVARAQQEGNDAVIHFDELTIRLSNVNTGDLLNAAITYDEVSVLL